MIVPSTAIASRGAALDAILPFDRRDQLAALLTDDDLATLKHLASEGMGENTLTELGYPGLVPARNGSALPGPAPESLPPEFVAHHLWHPVKRKEDLTHGMPAEVRGWIACPAPARTGDGAPPADHLVDPHPLARPDRRFRRAVAGIRPAACRPRQRSTTAAQEPEGSHRRRTRKTSRSLCQRSAG